MNKRKNSETGASGRRYRNITLTCRRGWIRWWWQMRTPSGSRWMSDNYITRCHRRLGSVQFQFQLEIGCQRSEKQLQTEGWGLQWPTVEQPSQNGQKNLGSICSSLSPTPTHLSHTRNITLSRIKCEWYIFIKKCVRSLKSSLLLIMFPLIFVYVYVQLFVAIQQQESVLNNPQGLICHKTTTQQTKVCTAYHLEWKLQQVQYCFLLTI